MTKRNYVNQINNSQNEKITWEYVWIPGTPLLSCLNLGHEPKVRVVTLCTITIEDWQQQNIKHKHKKLRGVMLEGRRETKESKWCWAKKVDNVFV
jgi:hypothetical protein